MVRDREQALRKTDDSVDEQYNEAEDDDYNPQQIEADQDLSSSDDDDTPATKTTKKRKVGIEQELDSGDEATIKERKPRKRRKAEEDGSEGEGGMIKTRSQRLQEKVERHQQKRKTGGQVTIDVEQVWNELNNLPVGVSTFNTMSTTTVPTSVEEPRPAEYILITRRIKFAGQVTEVEEEVLRSSDEAQKWLAEQQDKKIDDSTIQGSGLQKPLRRYSSFEPNPLGQVKGIPPDKLRRRAPTRMDMAMAERRLEDDRKRKAEKMTTMQKTALDWKGFVMDQGLGEELNDYGKSKGGFLAREQFLDKVHGANEVARKTARLKV